MHYKGVLTLQWCHNERNGVSNHWRLDGLLNRLFRRRSKKTSKLRVNGLCEGNSPGTGELPAQRTSNAEMFLFDDVTMRSLWDISQGRLTPVRQGNSSVSFTSSHRFTLSCIKLIFSAITTDRSELYLCYVRGEQIDKRCFSANYLIGYWNKQNYMHSVYVSFFILWEIKHLLSLFAAHVFSANGYIESFCWWKCIR